MEEDAQVSLAARNRDSGVRIVKGDTRFIKDPLMSKNVMVILEHGGLESSQQYLIFRGDDFDAGIRVRILHSDEDHPTTRGTLENLDLISQVTQQPIRNITISACLLICSWFGVSQSWSFLSLWGWVSARCGGVRTITSESWNAKRWHLPSGLRH
jgi:hypothetical protein